MNQLIGHCSFIKNIYTYSVDVCENVYFFRKILCIFVALNMFRVNLDCFAIILGHLFSENATESILSLSCLEVSPLVCLEFIDVIIILILESF